MLAATHVAEQERMHLGATAGVIDVPPAPADAARAGGSG